MADCWGREAAQLPGEVCNLLSHCSPVLSLLQPRGFSRGYHSD